MIGPIHREFTNELGNEITVSVTGYGNNDREGCATVLIRMAGPSTETTNKITVTEAQHLFEALGDLLYPRGKPKDFQL